jgi:hypothetical protein
MNNVTFIEITDPMTNKVTKYAMIDHGNEQFTSMLKSFYDESQTSD